MHKNSHRESSTSRAARVELACLLLALCGCSALASSSPVQEPAALGSEPTVPLVEERILWLTEDKRISLQRGPDLDTIDWAEIRILDRTPGPVLPSGTESLRILGRVSATEIAWLDRSRSLIRIWNLEEGSEGETWRMPSLSDEQLDLLEGRGETGCVRRAGDELLISGLSVRGLARESIFVLSRAGSLTNERKHFEGLFREPRGWLYYLLDASDGHELWVGGLALIRIPGSGAPASAAIRLSPQAHSRFGTAAISSSNGLVLPVETTTVELPKWTDVVVLDSLLRLQLRFGIERGWVGELECVAESRGHVLLCGPEGIALVCPEAKRVFVHREQRPYISSCASMAGDSCLFWSAGGSGWRSRVFRLDVAALCKRAGCK